MAKSLVTYSCGHTGETLGRNRKEADRRAVWLGQNICPDCEKAERDRLHAEENAAAKAAAKAAGLPDLIGVSIKQTDYAATVRAQQLARLPEIKDEIVAFTARLRKALMSVGPFDEGDIDIRLQSIVSAALGALDDIEMESSAKWWLDVGPIMAVDAAWNGRFLEVIAAMQALGEISEADAARFKALTFKGYSRVR